MVIEKFDLTYISPNNMECHKFTVFDRKTDQKLRILNGH